MDSERPKPGIKHRVAYLIYDLVARQLGARIKYPIRAHIGVQLGVSLEDHTHGWSPVRDHLVRRIAAAIDSLQEGDQER